MSDPHSDWCDRGCDCGSDPEREKQLEAEIESLRARLEEEHKDAMKWSGIAGAYTNNCNALTEKVESAADAWREMAVHDDRHSPAFGESMFKLLAALEGRLAPEPSKAQPSENT